MLTTWSFKVFDADFCSYILLQCLLFIHLFKGFLFVVMVYLVSEFFCIKAIYLLCIQFW